MEMAALRSAKWIVDAKWLENSPSRKDGIKSDDEKRSRRSPL